MQKFKNARQVTRGNTFRTKTILSKITSTKKNSKIIYVKHPIFTKKAAKIPLRNILLDLRKSGKPEKVLKKIVKPEKVLKKIVKRSAADKPMKGSIFYSFCKRIAGLIHVQDVSKKA
jgi:hypothetical protein